MEEAKERVPGSVTRVASDGVFAFTLLIILCPGPAAVLTCNDIWFSEAQNGNVGRVLTSGHKKSVNPHSACPLFRS